MRLSELSPRWYAVDGVRAGLSFRCPHCPESGYRLAVAVSGAGCSMDPEPDNPRQEAASSHVWTATAGDGFDDLSLTPSIDASAFGHWHGHITDGAIT